MRNASIRRPLSASRRVLNACALLALCAVAGELRATTYSFELGTEQPWSDGGTSSSSGQYVTVRAYVPGSNTLNYRTVAIYTPTYTSEANALGDVVGSVFHIYGSGTTAFVEPYDGPRRTVIYPAPQILHTRLQAINDERLAMGTYNVLGGHAAGRGFLYDVIYDQYTTIVAPDTEWTDLGDLNNVGQIVGTSINGGGAIRKGFVYDCAAGFAAIDVPGSSWTVPRKIDDQGNIYGTVSGIADASYFIARPDSPPAERDCSLVDRDDVAEPVVFDPPVTFELSGDFARGVKIGDFDGGGVNDLLVYHEPGKTILYLGEAGFDDKIKFYGDEFNTLAEGVAIETGWDFNNDGLIDEVRSGSLGNLLFLARADGTYAYVPQTLPGGNLKYGDLDGDGRVDLVSFSGAFATIHYQAAPADAAAEVSTPPAEEAPPPAPPAETVTPPPPAPDSGDGSTTGGDVPAIDPDAEEVESFDTIAEVEADRVLLSSGDVLWFAADTIVKLNDADILEPGLDLEFKAWRNPDGALVGIKVEVAE